MILAIKRFYVWFRRVFNQFYERKHYSLITQNNELWFIFPELNMIIPMKSYDGKLGYTLSHYLKMQIQSKPGLTRVCTLQESWMNTARPTIPIPSLAR